MSTSDNDPGRRKPLAPRPPAETSELAERIRRAQAARASADGGAHKDRQGEMSTLARGLRIGTEFVAALLVGSLLGYGIDQVAGTTPWALLGFFLLGFAAGILNVTRVVAELNAQTAASQDTDKTA